MQLCVGLILQMTMTENSLFYGGGNAENVNMPVLNLVIESRTSHKHIDGSILATKADIFLERKSK